MIEAQELTGYISQDKVLTGELSKTIEVLKPITQEKEVTPTKETQIIEPDKDFTGLSKVTVQSIPNEYIVPSGEIEFTQNGTYDVTDKASAKVNIKEKVLGTKTITSNGTYKAIDDNLDGYSEVEVATSGVDINEYLSKDINSTYNSIKHLIKKLPELTVITRINMNNFFDGMSNLTELKINMMNNVNLAYQLCYGCSLLKTIELKNTTNVRNMKEAFYGCLSLETLSAFNGSSLNYIERMFQNCTNIKYAGGIIDIGKAYETTVSENYVNYTLSFGNATKLTHDSLMNIINNLYDIKTKGVKPQKLVLGVTNLSEKLTSEEIAIATEKGWTLS